MFAALRKRHELAVRDAALRAGERRGVLALHSRRGAFVRA